MTLLLTGGWSRWALSSSHLLKSMGGIMLAPRSGGGTCVLPGRPGGSCALGPVGHGLDLDEQVRVWQLVYGDGRPGRPVIVEELAVHLVVPTEIVHVRQVCGDLHKIIQR